MPHIVFSLQDPRIQLRLIGLLGAVLVVLCLGIFELKQRLHRPSKVLLAIIILWGSLILSAALKQLSGS